MPKLKPLSDDKELSAIPVDEPVLVELEPPATGLEIEDEPAAKPAKEAKDEPKTGADEGARVLQEQMEEMRKANAAREANLARERDEARREAEAARKSAADTEADYITGALSAAQRERDSAKAAVKAAFDAGDADALADAQERLGRSAADIRELERAAAEQSQRIEREKDEPAKTQRQLSVEEDIDARPGLMDSERAWLKAHQDAVVDQKRNARLGVAYEDAIAAGHIRGTPEYFAFPEKFMGYTKPDTRQDDNDDERTTIVSAPVSRDNRSASTGRLQNTRVELTPAERQIARDMGISDIAYARGKQQLAANKASDPEKYARTR